MDTAEIREVREALARLENLQALVREDIARLGRIKGEVLAAVEKFKENLGFTEPELVAMRAQELLDAIEDAFETKEQGDDDTGT